MLDPEHVVEVIREGFADAPHPGNEFLQGSDEGCEPGEVVEPFKAFDDWRAVPVETLDAQSTALAFFSEGGLRFFLPAYLVADVRGLLQVVDPVFFLASPFGDGSVEVDIGGESFTRAFGGHALLNPRRFGAVTFRDHARYRLSVFCREEAQAIVAYLTFRRESADLDMQRDEIARSLSLFWEQRANEAPTATELREHVEREQEFIDAITPSE